MSIKVFRQVFLLVLVSFLANIKLLAQDISVYLESIDNYSGSELKAEFRVQSISSSRSYTLKDVEGKKYFELKKGDEVSIKVLLEGFYPEDKTIAYSDFDTDEELITFKLNKRPIARLNLSATEPERQRKQPAQFEVYLNSKLVGKGSTSKSADLYSLVLTEGGEYDIIVTGEGFEPQKYTQIVAVSTPINVVNKTLELVKSSTEIIVTFVDEQYGKPVPSQISVKDKDSGQIAYEGNPANGMFKLTFESGKNYQIEVKGAGYKDFSKEVSGPQNENISFKMTPITTVQFEVLNSQNKQEINGNVSLIAPSGKVIELIGEKNFLPEEKGNYKAVVTSDGYMSKSGTIMVNNFNGGIMNFTFELDAADQQFKIKVIDHYSREVLENVDFRVFSQAGVQLKGINVDQNKSWNFMTDNEGKYFIEASAEGYSDFTKNLKEEKAFDVELYWKPELTYAINLKDQLSREVVDNAELQILDSKGKPIFVFKTPQKGKYLARMYKNESYSYLIKSSEYQENVASLTNLKDNVQDLFLKRKSRIELEISFIDLITREKINPDYSVLLDSKPISVEDNKVVIEETGNYSLRALLKNYEALKVDNLEKLADKKLLTLEMKRETYPVKIYVKKMNELADFKDLKLTLGFGKNNALQSTFISEGLYFESYIQADSKYSVTVQKEGFERYTQEFDLQELAKINKNDLKLEIELSKLPEIVQEKTIEPAKVEPSPTIIETPPATLESKVKAVEEVLSKVPENQESLNKELTDKASIGKRYFLDQVNFDKASPIITDKIVDQLNKIALTLKAKPNVKIEIVGHTDNVGDPRANLGLSRFRAKAVANYLFNAGADPNRIIVVGKGQEEPIAANDTEENKAKNRRVEMILIEN